MSSDRHIAYPPCTGTNYRNSRRHHCNHLAPTQLGTGPSTNNHNKKRDNHPCRQITCASTVHHKPRPRIIIHLNTRPSDNSEPATSPTLGQTTHCQKPGPASMQKHKNQHARPDAPKPIHPDKRTILLPLNNSAGRAKFQPFTTGPLQEPEAKNRNTISP